MRNGCISSPLFAISKQGAPLRKTCPEPAGCLRKSHKGIHKQRQYAIYECPPQTERVAETPPWGVGCPARTMPSPHSAKSSCSGRKESISANVGTPLPGDGLNRVSEVSAFGTWPQPLSVFGRADNCLSSPKGSDSLGLGFSCGFDFLFLNLHLRGD